MPRLRSVLGQHRIEHLTHKALAGLGQLGDGLQLLLQLGGGPALGARDRLVWPNNSSSDTASVLATTGRADTGMRLRPTS